MDTTANTQQTTEAQQRPDMSGGDVVQPATTSGKDVVDGCGTHDPDRGPIFAGKLHIILNVNARPEKLLCESS